MGKNSAPLVSVIIVTYNSQEDIIGCVNSVLNQTFHDFEVIIVDNNSSDHTVERVRRNFDGNPKVSLVVSKSNMGYAGGNNLGCERARGELIAILNPDVIVSSNWLEELIKAYHQNAADVGIVCSNVLLFGDEGTINACGNDIHLTGLVFSRFYMEGECKCTEGGKVVPAPSGASMLFSMEKLRKIGRTDPFDTSRFKMEYSDIDLALDFLAYGFRCYVAPESRVYHKYKFKMNAERILILERGRYQILGHLTRRTLLSMLPALLLTELIVWCYIIGRNRNALGLKLKATIWMLASGSIYRKNNSRVKDSRIVNVMTSTITMYKEIFDVNKSYSLRLSNRFYAFIKDYIQNSLTGGSIR